MYKFFKRTVDILVSLIALPFVLLEILFLSPIIYLTDKGPVFYNAERRGRNGKVFKMYKLRSMYVNSPDLKNADGSTYNSDKDPRVTKIGKIMRKTSLDEFPQFLNVLKGDMSIIGPRPTLASNKTPISEMDEIRQKRYSVRPGITGYAQAYFRNSITQDEKFKHDAFYADNMSLWLDIKVIFKTVSSVLGQKNINVAESLPEKEKEPAGVK